MDNTVHIVKAGEIGYMHRIWVKDLRRDEEDNQANVFSINIPEKTKHWCSPKREQSSGGSQEVRGK